MSSGNAQQEQLADPQAAAAGGDALGGKLREAEIQRLVALSNDASFQRSERVPVKTSEAFEPRSLVSIAMAAQRRRESELRTAMAAGAVIDKDAAEDAGAQAVPSEGGEGDAVGADAGSASPAGDAGPQPDAGTGPEGAEAPDGAAPAGDAAPQGQGAGSTPSSTSQVDFDAGRAEGMEEGRRAGFEEGQAKGMEEGRAAGRAEASAQLERAIQTFESASARLTELTAIDSTALGASINEAILRLASERAGRAIAEQPDSFADRIQSLLATIRTVSGQPSIRLNAGDLASIQPLIETREKLRHCNFVADPALAAGDLSVMVGTIGIDDIIVPHQTQPAGNTQTPPLASEGSAVDEPVAEEPVAEEPAEAVTEALAAEDIAADMAESPEADQPEGEPEAQMSADEQQPDQIKTIAEEQGDAAEPDQSGDKSGQPGDRDV